MDLRNRRILIWGLGRSGLAALEYLSSIPCEVWVLECRATPELKQSVKSAGIPPERAVWGDGERVPWAGLDLVVASPGIAVAAEWAKIGQSRAIPVVSEMELALAECSTPIIGITGTNGKSTTTTLIGDILCAAGRPVVVGGNLGTPFLALRNEARTAEFAVLELSSF